MLLMRIKEENITQTLQKLECHTNSEHLSLTDELIGTVVSTPAANPKRARVRLSNKSLSYSGLRIDISSKNGFDDLIFFEP
jgi:hypothetical protein